MAFQVDVTGLESLRERVARLAALELEQLGLGIGEELAGSIQDRIVEEKTSPAGVPWAPWAPAYARRRHAGQSVLRASGLLGSTIRRFVEGAKVVTVGSSLGYAGVLHRGTHRMPARPYLGLSESDSAAIEAMAARFLANKVLGDA